MDDIISDSKHRIVQQIKHCTVVSLMFWKTGREITFFLKSSPVDMKIKDDEINLAAKYLYDNQEVLLEHYIYFV